MKKFFLKTIIVVIVAGIAYVLFFSFEKIDKNRISVVEDLRSKKMVRIVRPFAGNYAFAWQGAFPWWFLVSDIPAQRSAGFTTRITAPGLENLKEDYYAIRVPIRVAYRIDPDKFSDVSKLADDGRGVDDLVKRFFESELQRELLAYLAPAYQREALVAQVDAVLGRIRKNLEAELKAFGITLSDAKITGAVIAPERAIYNEGIMHAADLRKMDRGVEKELIDARSTVERENIRNEQLYKKLLEISRIISANPDILKYIYIDKMGGNVNVILSSDDTGVPRMLERDPKPAKGKNKEIDNLK
jgi:hypothetical protein